MTRRRRNDAVLTCFGRIDRIQLTSFGVVGPKRVTDDFNSPDLHTERVDDECARIRSHHRIGGHLGLCQQEE
jgi:hypothetical protein